MAYPELKLLIEVHGAVFVGGRHVTGVGFTADCEKYTAAAIIGYRILHFTSSHVRSGMAVQMIELALKYEEEPALKQQALYRERKG